MESELKSLDKHEVWDVCSYSKGTKITENKWVYTIKKEEDNKLKYKARLVAAGYNQVNNFDFKELYSSVISINAWRILIAIAAKKNLNV